MELVGIQHCSIRGSGECLLDGRDSLRQASRLDEDQPKTELAVGLFVDSLKAKRVVETDSSGFARRYETKIANEEYFPLIDTFGFDPAQFALKHIRSWISEVSRQGSGTDHGPVMKLYFVGLAGRTQLPLPLQVHNRIDEGRLHPRLGDTPGLPQGDKIRSSFFDDGKAFQFQLT